MQFKHEQKVKHPIHGEGTFYYNTNWTKYSVKFKDVETYSLDLGDDFYNQLEIVEDLPEVGEFAYFWHDGQKYCIYGKFLGESINKRIPYKVEGTIILFENISKIPPFK